MSAGSRMSARLVAAMTMMPLVGLEAVHLHEQLVEGLLALVVAAAQARAALPADGVDLVDEDDAGHTLLGQIEQVAHAGSAHADEHLNEVTSRRSRRTARLASPATALAKSVLPVPGGPTSSTPLGIRAPMLGELLAGS